MKKILLILGFITLFLSSCAKTEVIEAEFIFVQDAAVLKGDSFIYGVVLDNVARELSVKVEEFKKTKYDMVPVVVEGVIKDNPNKEGWKQVVEIKKILEVLPIKSNKPEKVKIKVEN